MSQVPVVEDMQALRDFITAKDGNEYVDAHSDTVVLNVTHSNLKRRIAEIRLNKHMTVFEVKGKMYTHCGTAVGNMELILRNSLGETICLLNDDNKKLGYYSVEHWMTIHVVDNDPFSLALNGGLEDVSQIKKYELSEDQYDTMKNTVRQYKKDKLAEDPNWVAPMFAKKKNDDPVPDASSVANIELKERCMVQPGARRGVVMFKGEIQNLGQGGYWVGVQFDEPVGKTNGTVKGKTYFTCQDKYGAFVRPQNVQTGDFPELDPLYDSDEM